MWKNWKTVIRKIYGSNLSVVGGLIYLIVLQKVSASKASKGR